MPARKDPILPIRVPADLQEALDAQRGSEPRTRYAYRKLYEAVVGREPVPAQRGRPPKHGRRRQRGAARRTDSALIRAWERTGSVQQGGSLYAIVPPKFSREPIHVHSRGDAVIVQWPYDYIKYGLKGVARAHGGTFERNPEPQWVIYDTNKIDFMDAIRARLDDAGAEDIPVVDNDRETPTVPQTVVTLVPLGAGYWIVRITVSEMIDDEDARKSVRDAIREALDRSAARIVVTDTDPGDNVEIAIQTEPVPTDSARRIQKGITRALGSRACLDRPRLATRQRWRTDVIRGTSDELGLLADLTPNVGNPRHWILAGCGVAQITRGTTTNLLLSGRDRETIETVAGLRIHTPQEDREPAKSYTAIPGWERSAPNGHWLFRHQREAVEHFVRHGGRILVGDEMGTGKTASAIAGAHAIGAQRVAIICPAVAAAVWHTEIAGWDDPGAATVEIQDGLGRNMDLPECGWVICTYDRLTPVTETIYVPVELPETARTALDELSETTAPNRAEPVKLGDPKKDGTQRVTIQPPLACAGDESHLARLRDDVIPALTEQRARQLRQALERLRAPVLGMLETWQPDLAIIDEAHRVKNPDALRSRAVKRLSAASAACVPMTGTPIRNRADEAGVLLDYTRPGLVGEVKEILRGRVTADPDLAAVRTVLDAIMLRRRKADVLTDLPPKLRTRYDVPLDRNTTATMEAALAEARVARTIEDVFALIARVRKAIGRAKIEDAANFAEDILDAEKPLIVFAHHKEVISGVYAKLPKARQRRTEILTGETAHDERVRMQARFQNGDTQCLIVSTLAGGEAITLTVADTALFVELDWVPGNLVQAEDRLHRAGQEADNVTALYMLGVTDTAAESAILNTDTWMAGALDRKVDEINTALREHESTPLGVPLPADVDVRAGGSIQRALAGLFVDSNAGT